MPEPIDGINALGTSFTLTGQAVTFSLFPGTPPTYTLTASGTSFVLTGNPVDVYRTLAASAATFAVTGLPLPVELRPSPGEFVLTGNVVGLNAPGVILAEAGMFGVFGDDAIDFTRTPPALNAAGTAFEIDGGVGTASRVMTAGSASFITANIPATITPPPPFRQWFGPSATACICECCSKPIVSITRDGDVVSYSISNAVTASLASRCNSAVETTTTITLSGGAATGFFTAGSGNCSYCITAENACGETIECQRNYVLPQDCDCLHEANETPDLWGSAQPFMLSISGNGTAPLPTSYGFSCTYSDCPTFGFSVEFPCGGPIFKKFRQTKWTGCYNRYTFHEFQIGITRTSWAANVGPYGVQALVSYRTYYYHKQGLQTTTNHYPTLTEILPVHTVVPWQSDTVFGANEFSGIWTGYLASQVAYLNLFGWLCDNAGSVDLDPHPNNRCRDRNSGNTVADCGVFLCAPTLALSMEWI